MFCCSWSAVAHLSRTSQDSSGQRLFGCPRHLALQKHAARPLNQTETQEC